MLFSIKEQRPVSICYALLRPCIYHERALFALELTELSQQSERSDLPKSEISLACTSIRASDVIELDKKNPICPKCIQT
jgi:hypothetical protein